MSTGFSKISFGWASAETESSREPALLTRGYVDIANAAQKAANGHEFLFLGYKGSGKTAIGQRITLQSQESHSSFCTTVLLADFPFTPFSKIIRGDSEPESKFPLAWSWLILIKILQSLEQDAAVRHRDENNFIRCMSSLRSVGLTSTDDVSAMVRKTSKSSFKISIPTIGDVEGGNERTDNGNDIAAYTESLRRLVMSINTPNKHIIIIDGLDDVLTRRSTQSSALGALFFEVARLNESFIKFSIPIKVIVLCRTDLFEKVSNANKNKTRQDSAVSLNWYHIVGGTGAPLLLEAANKRAEIALDREVDVLREYFPKLISGSDTKTFLLDHTRHTPRDFLQLLKKIQERSSDHGPTFAEVRNGTSFYSIDYFLPEIKDELDGYANAEEINQIFQPSLQLGVTNFLFCKVSVLQRLTV